MLNHSYITPFYSNKSLSSSNSEIKFVIICISSIIFFSSFFMSIFLLIFGSNKFLQLFKPIYNLEKTNNIDVISKFFSEDYR